MTRKEFNLIKGVIDKKGLANVSYNKEGRGKFFLLEISDSDKPPKVVDCMVVHIEDGYNLSLLKVREKLEFARRLINGAT